MTESTIDHEQLDRLKRLWQRYGRVLTAVVLIALLAFGGWRYYQYHVLQQRQQASVLYTRMLDQQNNPGAIYNSGEKLLDKYPDQHYASLAALWMAKAAVKQDKLDQAGNYLQWAMQHSRDNTINTLARQRYARLLMARNKPQQALDLLNKTRAPAALTPLMARTKGDVYAALDRPAQARQNWKVALKNLQGEADNAPLRTYLQARLQALEARNNSSKESSA